jgi:hypothetical protein
MNKKIEDLFIKLKSLEASTSIFTESGMLNKFGLLDYGFFPLGNGILNLDLKSNESFNLLILGNDFGTENYLSECQSNHNREFENKYPTIRNLKSQLKNIDLRSTFFTNLHLGVRQSGTNIKRVVDLKCDYQDICYNFFIQQLKIIKPSIVLCLGNEVRNLIATKTCEKGAWRNKNVTFKKLFEEEIFFADINLENTGIKKFIFSTHPCDGRNFKIEYSEKIDKLLKN